MITPAGASNSRVVGAKKIVFGTANGRTSVRQAARIDSKILRGKAYPYQLGDMPGVLSRGLRVIEIGYSFVWISGTVPILMAPDGVRIELEVEGNVPVLRAGDDAQHTTVCLAIPRPIMALEDVGADD